MNDSHVEGQTGAETDPWKDKHAIITASGDIETEATLQNAVRVVTELGIGYNSHLPDDDRLASTSSLMNEYDFMVVVSQQAKQI